MVRMVPIWASWGYCTYHGRRKEKHTYHYSTFQGEDLLVMGDARLKERRREKIKKSLLFPPPFNSSSSHWGLPPGLLDMFFHKDTDNLESDPTLRIIVCQKAFIWLFIWLETIYTIRTWNTFSCRNKQPFTRSLLERPPFLNWFCLYMCSWVSLRTEQNSKALDSYGRWRASLLWNSMNWSTTWYSSRPVSAMYFLGTKYNFKVFHVIFYEHELSYLRNFKHLWDDYDAHGVTYEYKKQMVRRFVDMTSWPAVRYWTH